MNQKVSNAAILALLLGCMNGQAATTVSIDDLVIEDAEAAKVINDLYLSGKIAVYPNVKAIIANHPMLTQKQATIVQIVNESLATDVQALHPETAKILNFMMNRATLKREMVSGNDTEIFRP